MGVRAFLGDLGVIINTTQDLSAVRRALSGRLIFRLRFGRTNGLDARFFRRVIGYLDLDRDAEGTVGSRTLDIFLTTRLVTRRNGRRLIKGRFALYGRALYLFALEHTNYSLNTRRVTNESIYRQVLFCGRVTLYSFTQAQYTKGCGIRRGLSVIFELVVFVLMSGNNSVSRFVRPPLAYVCLRNCNRGYRGRIRGPR